MGTGSYGVVRRCYHDGLKNVAVKCKRFNESTTNTSTSIDEVFKQVHLFTFLQHSHIVQTYGITTWGQCFGIIMEEVKGGNLHDLMILYKNIKIDWKLRYRIIFQLAKALEYLHFDHADKSYVHLDIKPENIMLTLNLSVKLADFGSLSIVQHPTDSTSTNRKPSTSKQHTPLYTAPERLQDLNTDIKSSMDVYSFAMVCYEVITRQAVFQDNGKDVKLITCLIKLRGQKPDQKIIDYLEEEVKVRNVANLEIFHHLKKIMEKCWCFKPENRLSVKEVLQRMIEFGGCKDPYESSVETSTNEIVRMMLQSRKPIVKCDKKISLKLHLPPFQCILSSTDNAEQTADKSPILSPDPEPTIYGTVDYDAESFKTSADDADVLGTGSYGTLRRCYHDLLKYVVVKCMHCGGSTDAASTSIDVARREIRFLTQLNHPHIVQTYGITSWDQCFGIIMEEVKGGDLGTLMVVKKNIEVDWKARYRIIFELADALRYLHSHNPEYVHLDVKPENVLLTLNLSVKLADFGLFEIARVTGATSTTTPAAASSKNQYTPLYTAPERLKDVFGTKDKSSMDVYSFAMVCYEVITRQAVFQDVKANVTLLTNLIASRGLKPNTQLIDNLEDEVKKENSADLEIFQHLKNVMEKCWRFKAEDRPSMKEVVQEMNRFGVCKESYESDTKSEADEITEPDQTAEQVSLKHFFPPFQRVSNFDASDKSGKHTDQ